jgi:heptaprenyl diphosphate synthase
VIRLQDIRKKLADIRGIVEQKVLHPYLLQYISIPVIDEDKLLILISIMDQLELSYSDLKNYALTTMLIQIALDTHEHVSNSVSTESDKEIQKNRQLNVLAGDYYSGMYYKLLADSHDISLIRALAEGIKDVNEHKMSVYQQDLDGIDKLMTSMKMIEGSLLLKLADYFHAGVWNEFTSNLLFVKRLISEKKQFAQAGSSLLFEALKSIAFPKSESKLRELSNEQKSYLVLICDRYIEFSKQLIEKALKHLPGFNELLEKRMLSILGQHQPIANTLVEEG